MVQPNPLSRSFYRSEDVVALSKQLLGKRLCTSIDGAYTVGKIVETEAYRGYDDKACHAYNNRRTARTEPIFAEGGRAYVYLCYGIHHLFNIVTAPADIPNAILIRAIEPVVGQEIMLRRRHMKKAGSRLTAGPGALTVALGIDSSFTGADLTDASAGIWIEDGSVIEASEITASPRVGVGYAEECADWPWRFRIAGNAWCSPAK